MVFQKHAAGRWSALFGLAVAASSLATPLLAGAQNQAAPTAPATVQPTLAEQIDSLISQPRFAGADWGIAVISLSNGRSVYSHHADQLFQPASTAKLFTAAEIGRAHV